MAGTFFMLSGEVNQAMIDFTSGLSGQVITGYTWYVPAGLTGYFSASGSTAIQVMVSATGAPVANSAYRVSGLVGCTGNAFITARRLIEYLDISIG